MGIPDGSGRNPPKTGGVRFLVGTVLMASSFLVYPAYSIIILLLPSSAEMKVAVIVAASILSWAVFSAGIFLAGREGYDWLKGLWKRNRRG